MLRRASFPLIGSLVALLACAAPGRAADQPPPAADLGLPFFDVYDPRDYQGHVQVWSAAEDADGVMYFGNYGCVLTYDGARWDRILVPNTSFVRGTTIDPTGVLWIGAVNELGYAQTDATGRRTFVSLRDRLPADARDFGELWRVVLTPRGPLFQSNSRLLRWDGHAFATVSLPGGAGWQLVAAGDTVWISQRGHGWFTVADDGQALTLVPVTRPKEFDISVINFAFPAGPPGEYILGLSRQGVVRWDGRTFTRIATDIDAAMKDKILRNGTRLPDGRMVMLVHQVGVFILDPQFRLLARLDEAAGLPGNLAITPYATRNGALWLTLQQGMVRVDTRPWLTWFGSARGAPRGPVRPPTPFRGLLYTTSDDGLLRLAPATAEVPARLERVTEFPYVLEGMEVTPDVLYGFGGEMHEWRGPGTKPVPLPELPNNVFEFKASLAQAGRWFALQDGGIATYRKENGAWKPEGLVPGLGFVRSLAESTDGTWWLGTPSEGVLRVTFPHATATSPGAPEITRYEATNGGLPAGHGWARVNFQGGRPLLRCELGLFRLDAHGQRWVPTAEFGARFADGTTTTRSMAEDARDGLWIAARPAGRAELVTDVDVGVATAAGWRALGVPQLDRLRDVNGLGYDAERDLLWIGGDDGLVRIDVALWRTAPAPAAPRVILRGAESGGRTLAPTGGWQLPHAQRALRVRFAAPDLIGDRGARFESTLLGGGEPVVTIDALPQRELPALAAGDYTLRLRARSGDGRWSPPLELAFTVMPPWWLSGWAWGAYFVAGVILIATYIRLRTRALRRRAAALEATVATRTEELRRSNLELARLHRLELDEKIAARLAEEKARLEVLRYQLNPHFLFNALTSVCAQLPPSLGGARAILERLSDFCQLTLFQPAGGESPTLGQEMEMLRAYLDIEQTRWGDLLAVTLEIDPAAAERKIPSLLLLPLVENALKYGQATSPEKLRIRLAARCDAAGALHIEVANSGQWVTPTERGVVPSLGIGHENLRQRLQRYYPGAHALSTESTDGWVSVRLRLDVPPKV